MSQPPPLAPPPALPVTATPRLRLPPQAATEAARSAAARRFGDAERPEEWPRPAGEWVAALLAHDCDREALAAALRERVSHIIELSDDGGAGETWLGVPPDDQSIYLSLCTTTAMSAQPAMLICDTLTERGVLPLDRRAPVELCLHEAVANGVTHGNLGVDSSAKDQPEGYRVFSQLINDRLRDPQCRARRIDVYVRWRDGQVLMSVADEGNGFDVGELRLQPDGAARSGRGFLFMRALADGLTIGDGGRCTTLRFEV